MERDTSQRNSCKTCSVNPRHKGFRNCYPCIRAKQKSDREERIKREAAKKEKKLRSIKGRKKLKKRAEALLHLYIRKRATAETGFATCYTCYRVKAFADLEAGHRHHGKLDLDPNNLKPQCTYCNHYLSGNLGEYERHLIEDYGLEWAKKLKQDADQDTRAYSYEFLMETIEKYTQLLSTV